MSNNDFKMDVIDRLARIEALGKEKCDVVADHEKRIRGLEKWRWWFAGVLALITFILPIGARYFMG